MSATKTAKTKTTKPAKAAATKTTAGGFPWTF